MHVSDVTLTLTGVVPRFTEVTRSGSSNADPHQSVALMKPLWEKSGVCGSIEGSPAGKIVSRSPSPEMRWLSHRSLKSGDQVVM